jgi:hypothetical protein
VRLERTTSGFVDLRSDSIELRSRKSERGREDLNLQPVRSKRTALNPLSYAPEFWRKVQDSNPYAIARGSFQDCCHTDLAYLPRIGEKVRQRLYFLLFAGN